jgi:glycosyltransferase involved in cell wall biosynthesis
MTVRRVLTFSSLYPSAARPRHGIFVETRLLNLVRDCAVDARVIAPVPWFPLRAQALGRYAQFAATPRQAVRNGVQVAHPRYFMLPKLGVAFQPDAMARSAWADIDAWRRAGWAPELIDAHYFYPDGVAAAILAERLQLPFIVTARGSDVNLLGRLPGPAARILRTAQAAAAVVTVSTRLKEALVAMGAEASKIVVLRNGVDLALFTPEDRSAARRRLGMADQPTAVCVGNLVPEKGFELAVEALVHLPAMQLLIVGEGPQQIELLALSERLGVAQRVGFRPVMPQAGLRDVYSAADVLLLTSLREGWPNVVLESLACGTPVVAMDVGAVTEMLTEPSLGRIVAERDPRAFASAVQGVLAQPAPRAAIRQHASRFGWNEVSRGQSELFARVLAGRTAAAALPRGTSPLNPSTADR